MWRVSFTASEPQDRAHHPRDRGSRGSSDGHFGCLSNFKALPCILPGKTVAGMNIFLHLLWCICNCETLVSAGCGLRLPSRSAGPRASGAGLLSGAATGEKMLQSQYLHPKGKYYLYPGVKYALFPPCPTLCTKVMCYYCLHKDHSGRLKTYTCSLYLRGCFALHKQHRRAAQRDAQVHQGSGRLMGPLRPWRESREVDDAF